MSFSPNNNHNPRLSPRDPAIRHAGRAHIRGKIRRVWRPRYLELCANGLVKYYELAPTANIAESNDSDWDHVHMIPKDTLWIQYARIIDVTTLRDLHVGLPRGAFGFLFQGKRQEDWSLSSKAAFSLPSSMLGLDNTTASASATSTSMGLLACANPTKEYPLLPHQSPPREYFCAVATLEEAQTWVVALQWAASQRPLYKRIDSSDSDYSATIMHPRNALTTPPPPQSPSPSSPKKKQQHPKGRTVVPKTTRDFVIVRNPNKFLEWQVAYEIAILIVHNKNPTSHNKVQEQRLYKTWPQFQTLLLQLLQLLLQQANNDDDDDDDDGNDNDKTKQTLQSFLSMSPPPPSHKERKKSFDQIDQILRYMAMEPSIVNSSLVKQFFCLTTTIQRNNNNNRIAPMIPKWYHFPPTRLSFVKVGRIPDTTTTNRYVQQWLQQQHQPNTMNHHHRSKQQQQLSTSALVVRLLLLPQPYLLGMGGLVLAFSLPLWKLYNHSMISISIRLDVLCMTWILAAYFGSSGDSFRTATTTTTTARTTQTKSSSTTAGQQQQQQQQQSRRHSHNQRSKPLPPIATTTPTTLVSTQNDDDENNNNNNDVGGMEEEDGSSNGSVLEFEDGDSFGEDDDLLHHHSLLSSPLPQYSPNQHEESCWSIPPNDIFRVRGPTYLQDRIKIPSGPCPFVCRGVDVWMTDNPQRHIAKHPSVLGGMLGKEDTFLVNFLLPFGNFVSYFKVPPLSEFPCPKLAKVWNGFVHGDQQYRDARLKLLPVVVDGPWIVKAAVGNGTSPALLGKAIPLQYYFFQPPNTQHQQKSSVYEVDVIITASSIAKGILSVVKGHTKTLTIAFAFIIEAVSEEELPESTLCAVQVHSLHLEDCPILPDIIEEEQEGLETKKNNNNKKQQQETSPTTQTKNTATNQNDTQTDRQTVSQYY